MSASFLTRPSHSVCGSDVGLVNFRLNFVLGTFWAAAEPSALLAPALVWCGHHKPANGVALCSQYRPALAVPLCLSASPTRHSVQPTPPTAVHSRCILHSSFCRVEAFHGAARISPSVPFWSFSSSWRLHPSSGSAPPSTLYLLRLRQRRRDCYPYEILCIVCVFWRYESTFTSTSPSY